MSDQYVGEIRMFSGNYAPVGWMFCNGQVLSISENEVLYVLLGTTYGGDGQTTFALPDLRGRLPIHQGRSTTGTSYVLGQKAGTETVQLISSQLPAHTHVVNAQSAAGTATGPANAYWAASTVSQYANTAADGTMNTAAVSSVGGNQAHENMMPSLPVSFIIAVQGIFPSQG